MMGRVAMSKPERMKADTWTPRSSNLVQRTCACGGSAGPGGECAACKAKRLAGIAAPSTQPGSLASASSRQGGTAQGTHSFSRMSVLPPAQSTGMSGERGKTPLGMGEAIEDGVEQAADGGTVDGGIASTDAGPAPTTDAGTGTADAGTAKTCAQSDLGTLTTSLTKKGSGSQASVSVKFTVTPPTTSCKCDQYRWVQVGDIIPGKWKGRDDAFVDPYPNDDSKIYYWTDAEEAASPNVMTDVPKLNRSRSTDEGNKRITFKFETACVGLRAGKPDRIVGMINWGFEFDTDQTKDTTSGPSTSNSPTSFWKDAVKKDFSTYKFEE